MAAMMAVPPKQNRPDINRNDVKSGSMSGSPRRRAPDYRISIDPWRRKEYLAAVIHQTSTKQ
jgi:hypothetical protein